MHSNEESVESEQKRVSIESLVNGEQPVLPNFQSERLPSVASLINIPLVPSIIPLVEQFEDGLDSGSRKSYMESKIEKNVLRRLEEAKKSTNVLHHRHLDPNKMFQSLANKQNSQSMLQYLKNFNLHHQDYDLSDAQLKTQLYKKIGDERTHLELINFQMESFSLKILLRA